jgi:hypothetical protein
MAAFSHKNAPITSDRQAVLLNDRNPLSVSSGSEQYNRGCELFCSDFGRAKAQVNDNRNAIPKRSVFNSTCTGTHPGVRSLAPKQVGRKEIPCKFLQSFKGNR